MLILASEISAAGCVDKINSLSFPVFNSNSGDTLKNFEIKLGHTTSTSISTWTTGLTSVYTNANYLPVTGNNTHTFSTAFDWNGTDNIIVEVCFNNTDYTYNASHYYTTTSFNSVVYYRADASGVCANTSVFGTSTLRPNMVLGYTGLYSFDAAVTSLTSPVAACTFTSSETVSIVLANQGTTTITSLPLAYRVNGGTAVAGTFSGSLAPNASTTFSFPTTVNLSSGSSFNIEVYVNSTSDSCQLNDTFSVNLTTQLSGDYTIGGASPDYSNLQSAISDLASIGVCGPVTFHVRSGTYNGALIQNAVSGVSATNTITFKADSTNTTMPVVQSASSYVWQLNGTSYVTIDGLELNMTGSAYVVHLTGFNKRLTIKNCVLNGYNAATSSTAQTIIYQSSSSTDYSRQFTLDNCTLNYGSYAAYFYGGSTNYNKGTVITNNVFQNNYYAAFYAVYSDTVTVTGNSVSMATSSTTQYGFYFSTGSQPRINANQVLLYPGGTGYGIFSTLSGTSTSYGTIYNNMVSMPVAYTSTRTGLYLSASYLYVYHNSVATNNTALSSTYTPCYLSGTGNYLVNNAFMNFGTGYACYAASTTIHNNNVFYTGGTTLLSGITLASSEFNALPGFNSITDLHISAYSSCYNAGANLTTVTTDIDGDSRTSTPDIGADEYTLPNYNAGVTALNSPATSITAGSNTVSVSFKNFGVATLTSINLDWEVNGNAQSAVSWSGSLTPGSTQASNTLGTYNFPTGFSTIKAWTYGPNSNTDEDVSNDTMLFKVCTPISGTFTIGGSSADFANFNEAAWALHTCGINGPVVLNVTSGTYNEQVTFNGALISGLSSTNTVTINGNDATITYNTISGAPHVVKLDGAKYFTIDNLNIESTSTSAGFALQFSNNATLNTVKNCSISVAYNMTSSSINAVVFSNGTTSYTTGGLSGTYNTISNNVISGGYFGICLYGSSTIGLLTNNTISNNTFLDFYVYGIYLYYAPNTLVEGNDLSRPTRTTISTCYTIYAATSSTPATIIGNRIHNLNDVGTSTSFTNYNIYVGVAGTASLPHTIANNAIYNVNRNTGTIAGIYNTSGSYANIYHNTIEISDPTSYNTGTVYGIYSTGTGVNIRNNNVSCTKTGGVTYAMYVTASGATINNNNLYVNTSNTTGYIGYYAGTYATLSSWQTANSGAYDQNSTSVNPQFVNVSSGNCQPTNVSMNNTGAALGYTVDITGAARSATTPDVGAWEFLNFNRDASLTFAQAEYFNTPLSQAGNIRFVGAMSNVGLDTLTNVTLHVNAGGQSDTAIIQEMAPVGSVQGWVFPSNLALSSIGNYSADFYTTVTSGDQNAINDSIFNRPFNVTDSVLSRDNGTFVGGIGFTGATGIIGNIFDISSADTVTQLAAYINGGGTGNTIRFVVYGVSGNVPAGSAVYQSDAITLTGANQWYYHSLCENGEVNPGRYFVAVEQLSTTNMALGRTTGIFTAERTYYGNGSTWTSFESAGFYTPAIIRIIMGHASDFPGITSSMPAICSGGSVTLNASAGYASYAWSNSGSSQTTVVSAAGTYYVTVTNNRGCSFEDSITVVSDALSASITGTTQASCGSSNGTATAAGSNGIGSLSYSWSNGASSATATGLDANNYTVTVSDSIGCTATAVASVTNAGSPSVTLTPTNVVCGGASTGAATSSVSGGVSPYSYSWSNSASTSGISGLSAGTYTVTVTDNVGCAVFSSVTISQNPVLSVASSSQSNVACNGGSSGSITAIASGGVGTKTYLWSNGATSAANTGLTAGTYTVTTTDAVSCTKTASFTITQPTALTASISSTSNVSCNGGANGSATVVASGGVGGNSFSWSGGGTSATKSGLTAGTYTVTVTNANSCTATASATITQPTALTSSVGTVTNVLCNGAATGIIPTSQSGGTSPYSYAWTGGGSTTNTRSNCTAGTYTVTVTDNLGCTTTSSATVTQPTLITAVADTTSPLCNGDTNGGLDVTTSGGVSPYSWSWNSGQTSEDISNMGAGTYTVTITDNNACVVPYTFAIGEPDVLSYTMTSVINTFCEYGSTGQIQVTTYGGTAPYVFFWSDSSSNEDITGLPVGMYSMTVTDTNGCQFIDSAEIGFIHPAPFVEITGEDTSCAGAVILISATGGFSSYSWSNGSVFQNNYVNVGGTYELTVTANNGCQNFASFDVFIDDTITLALLPTNVNCEGGATGMVAANVSGGLPSFSYVWSNGQTTSSISNLEAGSYGVTIEDAAGCKDSAELSIGFDHTNPTVDLGEDTIVCYIPEFDEFNSITLNAGSFSTYSWNTGENTASIIIDAPGIFSVFVTDVNGCNAIDSITIDSMICLGVDEPLMASTMKVYPNPTRDVANINIEGVKSGAYTMLILNMNGQIVMNEKLSIGSSVFNTSIDIRHLGSGIYVVQISNGTSILRDRISVE